MTLEQFICMILVKSLMIDPKDAVLVNDINLCWLPVVNETMPLYKVLDMFQKGKSHMGDHRLCRLSLRESSPSRMLSRNSSGKRFSTKQTGLKTSG